MKYVVNNKEYEVDSVEFDGDVINVFNTSITKACSYYTVFDIMTCDEVYFNTFEAAYKFAEENSKNI